MSGGLRWLDSSRIAGDVVAPANFHFLFSVEVKSRVNIHYEEKLKTRSQLYGFWEQAKADAARVSKLPLLLARSNGMRDNQWLVGMAPEAAQQLQQHHPKNGSVWAQSDILWVLDSDYLLELGYQTIHQLLAPQHGTGST